ncbi:unnamed protein product [Parascedosporium putredinis]|uniref:K Homology domain-containing protein n=1 Tax=Parascedosporium putredinis TaxID=1442378 RepID=A0A9P1MFA3_9PEZI|nr:unnamed protein product [Parascedosporium putredinis]CAI8004627.1 unnamed protein product [Parascedosporium putredinis]
MTELSAAERMAREHAVTHQAYIEPEEAPVAEPSTSSSASQAPTIADKVAGKQANSKPIDTQSHELFPELGSSKGKAAAASAVPTWGARTGGSNGASNGASSGVPAPALASVAKPAVSLPGRNVETITIDPQHVLPRQKLRRPIPDIIKDINKKSRAKITMSSAANGRFKFEATGPQDVAQQALKDLVSQIGTKTTISLEETQAALDEDDDADIHVTIEGNTISAASAREEILKIARERAANVQTKVRGIPPEFYPFIAGPQNSRAQALEEANGVRVQVPSHTAWTSQPLPGAGGPGQRPQFSAEGVEDHISLAGDRPSVQRARAEIERLAAELEKQLHVEQFSVQRGRHQFIIGNLGIPVEDFFADTGCHILLPTEGEDDTVTIIGPAESVSEAAEKAMDLALNMQCSNFDVSRFHRGAPNGAAVHAQNVTRYLRHRREIERLESLYNTRINTPSSEHGALPWEIYSRDGKNAIRAQSEITSIMNGHPRPNVTPRVREDFGVHIVVPEAGEGRAPVLLAAPSKDDVRAFQQGLEDARNHILNLINKQEEITSVAIEVPQKYHERLRRFIKKEQEKRSNEQIPIRVSSLGTKVTLRGPSSAVASLGDKVEKFIEQEKEDEKERGFITSFDFPQKFANHLIGKGGSNIRDLRDKFDVEIQVQDGKVELKGPKAKAESAKAHILSLGRTLADETTHVLKIDPKFHRELIGKEGTQINRLQTRYKQNPDEVIIRGPKKGADEARDELFSLHQYLQENSHTATVTIQQKQVPSLIGQGGSALEELRLATGAKIDIPADRDVELVEVQLKGTKAQVAAARKILEEKRSVFDDTVSRVIDVDRKHHKSLIGPGGANLRNLVVEAGGSDDRRELARTIQFPKQDADGDGIKVEGRTEVVDKIIAAIQEKVREWDSQVAETIDVPTEKHRSLIGRGGENKTGIKLRGKPENIAAAKEHIQTLLKEQEGETVLVPGPSTTPSPTMARSSARRTLEARDHARQRRLLPLITDDEDAVADAHSWTIVQNISTEEGDIPWVLRGSADNVEKAKKAIQTALDQSSKQDTTGLLVLPDPRTYRLVIGPGGSKVKTIRGQSGCRITVPRDQAKDEPIEIVGSQEGVEKAKELILAAIKEGANRSRD